VVAGARVGWVWAGMSFLDQLTAVLRDPPGVPGAPPEGAVGRWHRQVVADLVRGVGAWDTSWASLGEARRRLVALWERVAELSSMPEADRVRLVEEVLARRGGGDGVAFASGFVEDFVRGCVDWLAGAGRPDPLHPVRYLVEVGALDASGARRTALGDLLLEFGPRDRIVGLLHAEVVQSTGWDDTYRVRAAALRLAVAARTWTDDPDDPDFAPIAFWRLEALGVIEGDSIDGPTTWRLVADRSSWLEDVVAEPVSPLGQLVRGALADQRLAALGGAAGRGASVQAALREFAELVTHDLRNVILPMRMDVGQLRAELGDQHRTVVRVSRSIERLEAFAAQVGKLNPGGTEEHAIVALWDVVADAMEETKTERNGRVRVRLDLPEVALRGPPNRLRMVFVQLLRNAAQAAVGEVAVRVAASVGAGGLTLTVEDDGPGVPPELEPRLFERGTSGRGGSGIGLALVRAVVRDELGGDVRYEAAAPTGARFVLTLPTLAE
jgi:signal transduction histidine kinase